MYAGYFPGSIAFAVDPDRVCALRYNPFMNFGGRAARPDLAERCAPASAERRTIKKTPTTYFPVCIAINVGN
jgi:hypothetical protein